MRATQTSEARGNLVSPRRRPNSPHLLQPVTPLFRPAQSRPLADAGDSISDAVASGMDTEPKGASGATGSLTGACTGAIGNCVRSYNAQLPATSATSMTPNDSNMRQSARGFPEWRDVGAVFDLHRLAGGQQAHDLLRRFRDRQPRTATRRARIPHSGIRRAAHRLRDTPRASFPWEYVACACRLTRRAARASGRC